MKISELIVILKELEFIYGDMQVGVVDGEFCHLGEVEFDLEFDEFPAHIVIECGTLIAHPESKCVRKKHE